jgi:uncharacterized membrane protein
MARFCESCGKEMGDVAAYCQYCGKAATPPAADGAGSGAGAASAGLQSNLAAALAYLWITAIILLLLEPYNRDKFVRFHAFQALFLGLASIAGHLVLTAIPILGWTLMPLWSLLILVLAVVAAVKAYQQQAWLIPVIGPFAQEQV